jgi:hypothetical protein
MGAVERYRGRWGSRLRCRGPGTIPRPAASWSRSSDSATQRFPRQPRLSLPPAYCSRFASFPSKPLPSNHASPVCALPKFVRLLPAGDGLLLGTFGYQPRRYVLTMINLPNCVPFYASLPYSSRWVNSQFFSMHIQTRIGICP